MTHACASPSNRLTLEGGKRLGKYKDLQVIDQLVKHGADLSASRHVIDFSDAPSLEVAEAMRDEASSHGFAAEVR